jgi:hypothetical protein
VPSYRQISVGTPPTPSTPPCGIDGSRQSTAHAAGASRPHLEAIDDDDIDYKEGATVTKEAPVK